MKSSLLSKISILSRKRTRAGFALQCPATAPGGASAGRVTSAGSRVSPTGSAVLVSRLVQ